MQRLSPLRVLIALLSCLGILSCDGSKRAGGFSDETETTQISGILRTPAGAACARTTVILRQDYRSATSVHAIDSLPAFQVLTDSSGKFIFSAVAKGTWHLQSEQDSLGILRTLLVQDSRIDLGTDTVRALQTILFSPDSFATSLLFIPQLNRVIDLSQGTVGLRLPLGTYEAIPVQDSLAVPTDTNSTSDTVQTDSTGLWKTLGLWLFTHGSEWTDNSGNQLTLLNVNAPPTSNALGYLTYAGNECIQINHTPALSPAGFRIDLRLRTRSGITTPQSILCADDSTSMSEAWCLRILSGDSLVFWFRDNLSEDSLVVEGIVAETWTDISAFSTGQAVVLQTTAFPLTKTVVADFSALVAPMAIGCSNASGPSQFFSGDLDYLQFSEKKVNTVRIEAPMRCQGATILLY